MSSLTHPVGPEQPVVYWRRRLALIVALVAIVWLVASTLVGGGKDGPTAAGATEAQAKAAEAAAADVPDDPDPSPTPGSIACTSAHVQVVATADAGTYQADATPSLGISVRNAGTAACVADLGPGAVELLVMSGEDRIWSSVDCPSKPVADPDAEGGAAADTVVVTVKPSEAATTALSWQRQRSAEGCAEGLPELLPGTYQLTARLGEITTEPVSFTLE